MIRSVLVIAVGLIATPILADEPTLKPDPPAKPAAWPAAVPPITLPALSYPGPLPADLGGTFILVSVRGVTETSRSVYDLRTGKKIGEWTSSEPASTSHALSPDGKLYVAIHTKAQPMPGPAPRQPQRELIAFDTTTGKRLWEVELTSYAYRVIFAGPDRIFIDRGNGMGNGPELYDAKTGKLVRGLPNTIQAGPNLSASPGGAYVASIERGTSAVIFSTQDGAIVKRFTPPQGDPNRPEHIQELAFSPDGTRLSAVMPVYAGTSRTLRIVSWNLGTGEQDADTRLAAPLASMIPSLRWSVDSKAWFVIGVGMVDPDTGGVLWRRPFDPASVALFVPISASRLLTFSRSGALHEITVPKEKINAALKAIRSGGLTVDGWLPAIAKADRSAGQTLTIPQRADDWTYKPDPVTAADRKPLKLSLPITQIASVQVANKAVVCELVESPRDSLSPRRLVRVDLTTGKPTGQTELPHVARLADVSPGGEMALTVDTEDTRRVDVWDLGTGKPVAGWRPAGIREPGGELLYASLLSADRALTLTRGGELAVWSVPGAKAVYSARLPGLGVPTRSAGRKYLFALQGDTVRVIEAATGKLVGDLATDTAPPPSFAITPGPWSPSPLAVRPDGAELTAILMQPAGLLPQVRRWDLATAKLHDRFGLPGPGVSPTGSVRYAGPDHLLLADSELIGLASHSLQWRYTRPETVRLASANDGRFWYAAGDFSPTTAALVGAAPAWAAPSAVLVAAELPHPTAVAAQKAAADNTADNLLGPGKKVGLKLDLDGSPNDKVKESVRATLTDALKARGLEATDDKAEVVLTATAKSIANGPKVSVRKLLPGENGTGTVEKVDMPFIATRLELTAGSQTVWEGGEAQLPPPYGPQPYRLPAKDTDLTGWLRDRAWARLSDTWGKLNLPRSLIRTPAGLVTLPGTSDLGPEGPRPIKTQRP